MLQCEYKDMCIFHNHEKVAFYNEILNIFYCSGKYQEKCARRAAIIKKEAISNELLPNGDSVFGFI